MVVDLFGLSVDEVRERYPAVYQWLLERVKPERDNNKREVRRRNWWLFGETNPKLRHQLAGLPRYIATVETTKHRLFTFLSADILPDNMLVNIAVDSPSILGVLSSRLHVHWALSVGERSKTGLATTRLVALRHSPSRSSMTNRPPRSAPSPNVSMPTASVSRRLTLH